MKTWADQNPEAQARLDAMIAGFRAAAKRGGYAPALKANSEAVEVILEAIEKAGYVPGADVAIALDRTRRRRRGRISGIGGENKGRISRGRAKIARPSFAA